MAEKTQAKTLLTQKIPISSQLLAQSDRESLNAFFYSGRYTYCDAQMVGEYWGQSVRDAKVRMGRKILEGRQGMVVLEQFMAEARALAVQRLDARDELCYFREKGYTYNDAVALARFWNESTPWEAKLRAEKFLILGNYQAVRNAVDSATD